MNTTTKLLLAAAALLALLGLLATTGPSDVQAAADTAADAQDAPRQAAADLAELRAELARQQAAKPHLWTPETIARADAAVGVVVAHRATR